MIKELFFQAVQQYTSNETAILALWAEVEEKYSEDGRHYHNLDHLDNLAKALFPVKDRFTSWNIVVFSIAYHDIIYNVLKQNNEERSADHAGKRLASIAVPAIEVQQCKTMILATKNHQINDDHQVNFFTDADLSILGAPEEVYTTYFNQIRKEYAIHPGLVYWPGRKKVLQHFLNMPRIFKTDYFFEKYEAQARLNIEAELRFIEKK